LLPKLFFLHTSAIPKPLKESPLHFFAVELAAQPNHTVSITGTPATLSHPRLHRFCCSAVWVMKMFCVVLQTTHFPYAFSFRCLQWYEYPTATVAACAL